KLPGLRPLRPGVWFKRENSPNRIIICDYLWEITFVLFLFCRRYNSLTLCVENGAKTSLCMGHMFLIDEVLLQIHQTYFSLCRQVQDPPLLTAFMLMAPGVVFTLFMPFLCVHLTTRLTAAM
uniref:Uncharacterized protein n=1 Tax=Kryptolebias marmoratus TaxID=37003 RepID=A0A3Q2ZEX8_KRYMA